MTASPAQRLPLVLAGLLCVLLLAPGAGDSSGRANAADAQILRIGTLFYVDTLNPLVGIETNDTTAYTMVFPQLVQYAPGPKIAGDWASGWSHSDDWLTWTFRLRKGKWSDGVPLTARDAVWTIRTILKYKSGPTSYVAGAVEGIKGASAPNPRTLVITYARPIAPVLSNLAQLFILPQHVLVEESRTRRHRPEGVRSAAGASAGRGRPVHRHPLRSEGHDGLQAEPVLLRPEVERGRGDADLLHELDVDDRRPDARQPRVRRRAALWRRGRPEGRARDHGDHSARARRSRTSVSTRTRRKPKNRELLSPRLKEAFEYAIPRHQIVDVIFSGHAQPWANILSPASKASGWLNPAVKPLPYNIAKANRILDALGLERGSGGLRVVPATSGKYAQSRHTMSYGVIVPKDLDFNGERQYEILATAFRKIGVQLNLVPGGDGAQAYELITAPNGTYLKADMYTWYWHPYIDPSFNLSVVTKAEWYNNSDTGFDDPLYDSWWKKQSSLVDFTKRQALVWKMEAYLAQKRPYIQLVVTDTITAHASNWTGFEPTLGGSCKCYFTAPRPTS